MKTVLSLFSLLPVILQAIVAAEQTIAQAGAGASKKEIVLAVIESACKVGETIDQKVIAGVSLMIDSLVGVLNKSIFVHKAA